MKRYQSLDQLGSAVNLYEAEPTKSDFLSVHGWDQKIHQSFKVMVRTHDKEYVVRDYGGNVQRSRHR